MQKPSGSDITKVFVAAAIGVGIAALLVGFFRFYTGMWFWHYV